ncbi:GtrA family protein [Jeotgalibacillus sp. R-1-5s-1]|uniref:GtrA family protein n=1 Tax=Jeotgalibacillus sp. R-1-5s-1 TaxID=2555897 RepID=UPI00106C55F5|nr:GtrA family protein [Jeotgalibacillus sp. R-1-5s-1]TFD95740.1 GtrA family protein [Jeotgalibacillus sp. R-1-5s-1]
MNFLFSKEFWRFVIVGFINTFNYYILYLFFIHVADLNYLIAHLGGFVISMVGSFYLNSYFTYRTKPTLKKFLQFPLTYVVNITVTTSAIFLLVEVMKLSETISPLLASGIAIPFTFLISKIILTKEQTN